jgi:NodT family efflux transporter outer membrane factor (OMF) lipoprotein
VAEIARTYVDRRAAQRRLERTQLSLELQQSTLAIVEQRVEAGLSPGLDAARTRGEVATLRAEIGPLRAAVAQLDTALAVLLGENPGSVDALLDNNGEIPTLSAGNAVGVPSNLLRRRPDIQAAELAIVAATAEVGVQTADRNPSLSLPGTIPLGVDDIGSGAATEVIASLSALLSLPLFDGGQREAEVTAAEERVIQAVWSYRRTLLQAVDEVERALLGYEGARERLADLEDAIANNRAAFEQSRILYQGGFASFLEVFDSQRTLNTTLQELAFAQRDVAIGVIDLYTALGTSLELPES